MLTNGHGSNGSGGIHANGRVVAAPPERIRELADACVRFVQTATGVTLDYEAETLSVLDYYLEESRKTASERPEALIVIAHAAGAYFGEVVRRRYPSWWRADGEDAAYFRIELEPVYLSFSPVQLVADALFRKDTPVPPVVEKKKRPPSSDILVDPAEGEDEDEDAEEEDEGLEPEVYAEGDPGERLEVPDEDRDAIAMRLGELPAVSEREFYAPSTRLEVLDIAIETIRSRRMGEGDEADAQLEPDDYLQ